MPKSKTAADGAGVVDTRYRKEKARCAKTALDRYEQEHDRGADLETLVVDLMADLMHLAAEEGLRFDSLLDLATTHYETERRGDL